MVFSKIPLGVIQLPVDCPVASASPCATLFRKLDCCLPPPIASLMQHDDATRLSFKCLTVLQNPNPTSVTVSHFGENTLFRGSSMAEHSALHREGAGSTPAPGLCFLSRHWHLGRQTLLRGSSMAEHSAWDREGAGSIPAPGPLMQQRMS